jgi:23S rRNA (cytidine1920-2'-O)/16S rRNA (cytidine1409-2'-O)-methyltransferase
LKPADALAARSGYHISVSVAVQNDGRRERLDKMLVLRGLVPSRARAQDLIRRGLVRVGDAVETSPGALVRETMALAVAGGQDDVSRGACKLAAALDHFAFSPAGLAALDVGAATGGFTQVLLRRGASRVYAVDVGHGQLHPSLAGDPRVVALEGCDARSLDAVRIPEPVGAIVADVSFISLTKALAGALVLAAPGAWLVALVKPQFEAGRAAIGKGGIVRDPAQRARATETVRAWLAAQPGWRIVGLMPSPIAGGSGNQEFLLGAVHDK